MDSSDLCICTKSAYSSFIGIGADRIIQIDLQPFLTQPQLESGSETKWFKQDHLEELLKLLQPYLIAFSDCKVEDDFNKNTLFKDCILVGDTIRVACLFKKQSTKNVCLLTHFHSSRKRGKKSFSEVSLHPAKIVAYICPRVSSTALHFSQIVHRKSETYELHQDISKYFHIK